MSYLDSVIIDKPAIVIDIGHAYTKCGFAGETGPHTIIPSRIYSSNKPIKIHDYNKNQIYKQSSNNINLTKTNIEEETLREILIEFLYRIFYKILNSNSRERKLVIVESILTNSFFRKILADVLFKNFQVVSILFLPSHLASLYTVGINTGLVIDCGYVDCQVLPISESVPMAGLCQFVNLGAERLHKEIENLIKEHAFLTYKNEKIKFSDLSPPLELSEETLEDIKLRCCFVTSHARSLQIQNELKSVNNLADLKFEFAPDCDYNLSDDKTLHLPGYVRECAFEILFVDPLDTSQTIQHSILDTLTCCPIDLKKKFAENILLMGGTCMLAGFKNRLVNELNHLIDDSSQEYSKKLAIRNFSFHVPPSQDNYTGWLGGAIFGALDTLDNYSIQNSKYKDNEKIPDWFNITSRGSSLNRMVSI